VKPCTPCTMNSYTP